MSVPLPEHYKRVLSSLTELIEQKVTGILRMLEGTENGHVIVVRRTLTQAEREEKIRMLHELLEINRKLFHTFDLTPVSYNEEHILTSDLSWLWTIINNSTSTKLKGYGKLDRDTAGIIDRHIANLLAVIDEFEKSD